MAGSVVIAVLMCCAAAILVVPVGGGRRRFIGVFAVSRRRIVPWRQTIRAAVVLGVLMLFVVGTGPGVAAVVCGVTTAVRTRRAGKARERCAQARYLLAGLEAVIAELRVGAHPAAAADAASVEAEGAAARVFAVSAARSRLGGSGADAFADPKSLVADDLSRIGAAWRIAETHGLALADLLGAAHTDLADRLRFADRTHAALAGPRASATVLAGLPVLGLGLGQLMGAAPLSVVLGDGVGAVLLPLGCAFACAGLLWTDALTGKVVA